MIITNHPLYQEFEVALTPAFTPEVRDRIWMDIFFSDLTEEQKAEEVNDYINIKCGN